MDYMMWAKAVLLCSRHLKGVIENIDVSMDTLAQCSGAGVQDTYLLMEHAADLIARKTRIINLRVITTDMLNSLPQDKRRVLTSRYLTGNSAEAVSEEENIPLRSAYRRINTALSLCADYLRRMGFDNEYFEKRYGDERWIVSVFRKFTDKEDAEYEKNNRSILPRQDIAAPGLFHALQPGLRGGGGAAV